MANRGCGCCDCRYEADSFVTDRITFRSITFHTRKYKVVDTYRESWIDYDADDKFIRSSNSYDVVDQKEESKEISYSCKSNFVIAGHFLISSRTQTRFEQRRVDNEETGGYRIITTRVDREMKDGTELIKCAAEVDLSEVYLFGKEHDGESRLRSFYIASSAREAPDSEQDIYRYHKNLPSNHARFDNSEDGFVSPEAYRYLGEVNPRLADVPDPDVSVTGGGTLLTLEENLKVRVGLGLGEELPETEEEYDQRTPSLVEIQYNSEKKQAFTHFTEGIPVLDLLEIAPDSPAPGKAVLFFEHEELGVGFQSNGFTSGTSLFRNESQLIISPHDFLDPEFLNPKRDPAGEVEHRRYVFRNPSDKPSSASNINVDPTPPYRGYYEDGYYQQQDVTNYWGKRWKRIGDEEYITRSPFKANSVFSVTEIMSLDFWNSYGDEVYEDDERKVIVEFINSETDELVAKQEFYLNRWANRLDDFSGVKHFPSMSAMFAGRKSYEFTDGGNDYEYKGFLAGGDNLADLSSCSNPLVNTRFCEFTAKATGRHFNDGRYSGIGSSVNFHNDPNRFGFGYFTNVFDTPYRLNYCDIFNTAAGSITCLDKSVPTVNGGVLAVLRSPRWSLGVRHLGQWSPMLPNPRIHTPPDGLYESLGKAPDDTCQVGGHSGCFDISEGYYDWRISSEGSWGNLDHFIADKTTDQVRTSSDLSSLDELNTALKAKFGDDFEFLVRRKSFHPFGIPKRVGGIDPLNDHITAVLRELAPLQGTAAQRVKPGDKITRLSDRILFQIQQSDKAEVPVGYSAGYFSGFLTTYNTFYLGGEGSLTNTFTPVFTVQLESSDVLFPFSIPESFSGQMSGATGPGKFRIREDVIELANCLSSDGGSYDWKHIQTNHNSVPLHCKFKIVSNDPRLEYGYFFDVANEKGKKNQRCDDHGCEIVHPYNTIDFTVKSAEISTPGSPTLLAGDFKSAEKAGCSSTIHHGSTDDSSKHELLSQSGGIVVDFLNEEKWDFYKATEAVFVEPNNGELRVDYGDRIASARGESFVAGMPSDFKPTKMWLAPLSSIGGTADSGTVFVGDTSVEVNTDGWIQDKLFPRRTDVYEGSPSELVRIDLTTAQLSESEGDLPDDPYSGPDLFIVSAFTESRVVENSSYVFKDEFGLKTEVSVRAYEETESTEDEGADGEEDTDDFFLVDVECTVFLPSANPGNSSSDFRYRFYSSGYSTQAVGSFYLPEENRGSLEQQGIPSLGGADVKNQIMERNSKFVKFDRGVFGYGIRDESLVQSYSTVETGIWSGSPPTPDMDVFSLWDGSFDAYASLSASDSQNESNLDFWQFDSFGSFVVGRGMEQSTTIMSGYVTPKLVRERSCYSENIGSVFSQKSYVIKWTGRKVKSWSNNEVPDITFSGMDDDAEISGNAAGISVLRSVSFHPNEKQTYSFSDKQGLLSHDEVWPPSFSGAPWNNTSIYYNGYSVTNPVVESDSVNYPTRGIRRNIYTDRDYYSARRTASSHETSYRIVPEFANVSLLNFTITIGVPDES